MTPIDFSDPAMQQLRVVVLRNRRARRRELAITVLGFVVAAFVGAVIGWMQR